jgi:hypothetical protein
MSIKTLRHKWLVVFGCLFLLFSYIGFNGVHKAETRSLNLTTKVTANTVGIGKCDRFSAPSSTRGSSKWIFIPTIEYEYEHAGSRYVNTRIYRSRDTGFFEEKECRKFVLELQEKRIVDAWIDPIAPNFSTIDSTKRSMFIEQAIGFLGAFIVFLFFFSNYRREKKL